MIHHPLRFIVPPLVIFLGWLAVYIPWTRHKKGERERPEHNPHKPLSRNIASSVIAITLIVAFISAFILP
ncbi:MAG: hypothetical protein WA814_04570 [Candidatus Baltobacteraceae bacterium]